MMCKTGPSVNFKWYGKSLFPMVLIITLSRAMPLFGQSISDDLENYIASYHTEKIYISHDKPYYFPGDTIWAKVFFVDGVTHQNFEAEPIVYVDWFLPNDILIKTYNLKINNGTAALDIPIKIDDTIGNYTIRAYTLYQRNFDPNYSFQKEIEILNINSIGANKLDTVKTADFTLQFFPEGGDLVQGLENNLYFLAKDTAGQNISVKGIITDGLTEIVGIQSTFNGLGKTTFVPEQKKTYTAIVEHEGLEKKFDLPITVTSGYSLSVNSVKDSTIDIKMASSAQTNLKNAELIGHARGQVFLTYKIEKENQLNMVLKKKDLYNGILHFTLFDPQGLPVAERLIFNENPQDKVYVAIDIVDTVVGKRAAVTGSLTIEQYGAPTVSNLSISAYLTELQPTSKNSSDIYNYLLLQSDIPVEIPNIGTYFNDNPKTNARNLDLLLATYGWRRFNWTDVLTHQNPAILYPTEEHFSIIGTAKKTDSDKSVQADVSLFLLDESDFTSVQMTTDESGLFAFSGFDFYDTTEILIQSNVYNERKTKKENPEEIKRKGNKYIDLELIRLDDLPLSTSSIRGHSTTQTPQFVDNTSIKQIRSINNDAMDIWTIDLDEIVVKSRINKGTEREIIAKKRYEDLGLFYSASTQKFLVDEQFDKFKFESVFEMIKHVVPRAKMVMRLGEPVIIFGRLSAQNKALISLDGQIVRPEFLMTIDPKNIALIDIMEGLYASLYEDPSERIRQQAFGPLIMLISKDPSKIKIPNPGVINFAHPGYYKARTFYSTIHPENEKATTPDIRTTLYWDPWIDCSEGPSTFKFYTGDLRGKYLIKVEGITDYGTPFVGTKVIRVE